MLFLSLFFLLFLKAQDGNTELMIQSALHEEKTLGNIPKAIEIYHTVLSKQDFSKEMKAKVHLRLALCYEKMGNIIQAQDLYENMIKEHSDFTEITRIVNSRLREILRRKEIAVLKEKLSQLQASNEKIRLEEEIKKLQERIQSLVKSPPEAKSQENPKDQEEIKKDSQKVEERISDALSSHLYKIGKNLYQQGLLWSTRENLKKSLEFNPKNSESLELLERVENLIQEQEKKIKEEKGYTKENNEFSIKANLRDPQSTGADFLVAIKPELLEEKGEDVSFIEKRYDAISLLAQWKIKEDDLPEESLWSNVLVKFLRETLDSSEWKKNSYIKYQNKNFFVNQSISNHKKLEDAWQKLGENSHLVYIKGILFSKEREMIPEDRISFVPNTGGLYYAFLPKESKEKYISSLPPIQASQEIFLLNAQKQEWKHFFSVPLIQGYQERDISCKIYKEGLHFTLRDISQEKKVALQILVKKMQRPIHLIYTNNGPMHIPCLLTQQGEIEIGLEEEKNLLLGGLMDILDSNRNNPSHSLFALISFQRMPVLSFLKQESKSEKRSEEEYTQTYDVDFLQKIQDVKWNLKEQEIFLKEDRNPFILEYFQDELARFQPKGNAQIFKNFLVVHAISQAHQKVKERLEQLKSKQKLLCGMDIYLISCDRNTLKKILEAWKIPWKEAEGLSWYTIESNITEVLKKYKEFSDLKILYNFNSVVVGNTQKVSLKNCQILSYIDSLKYQEENPVQILIQDIHEGIRIDARALMLTEKEGSIHFLTTLSKIKGERKIPFSVSPGQKAFLSIPELNIFRFQINIPFKKGECHIVSGFQEAEIEKGKELFLFIVPDILSFVSLEKNQ